MKTKIENLSFIVLISFQFGIGTDKTYSSEAISDLKKGKYFIDKCSSRDVIPLEESDNGCVEHNYDGCNYNHKIDKKEIEIHEDNNVWFSYFDFGKYHFEVWGGLDEDNNPITGGESKNGFCSPFAVNVYIIENDEGVQVAQIDDVDIIECV